MTKSCVSFLGMPHPHKMSDINFGTQGRNVCMGFCKKVSVCKLQRGKYLIRRHDFGKNYLLARAMEEDTSLLPERPKMPSLPNLSFCQSAKKCHLFPISPSPQPTHPYVGLVIAEYEIILLYGKCYWSVATPIFRVKQASNSQDTVDYIVQRAILCKGQQERIVRVILA